ncbi:O-fucosyltransferase 6-like isoform X1 [Apium graveolens]|uniref:O-fucosyltransferase 6-like isoform X1 n=1 Tax=Apium graveolens TaxID=4045 RepID=UPI003D7979B2
MDYAGDAITDNGNIWRSWSKYFYGCCKASNDFASCYYSGGEKEKNVLGKLRRRWKTLHISDPLTPEEVGLMLRALGTVKMFICMWL